MANRKDKSNKPKDKSVQTQKPVRAGRKKKKDQFDRMVDLLRSSFPQLFVD